MIINQRSLLELEPLYPMVPTKETHKASGTSWGLTECGYDVRIKRGTWMFFGRRFVLASTVEKFRMPSTLMGRVLNKSTWARRGIDASMTTNIEPGFVGFLTLELRYAKFWPVYIPAGSGIAQIIFEQVETPMKYSGKYQHQPDRPVKAIRS